MTNVMVTEATIDKYLRINRGRMYWWFMDSEKDFNSNDREALWFKMRRRGTSDSTMNSVRKMYSRVKFCLNSGQEQ